MWWIRLAGSMEIICMYVVSGYFSWGGWILLWVGSLTLGTLRCIRWLIGFIHTTHTRLSPSAISLVKPSTLVFLVSSVTKIILIISLYVCSLFKISGGWDRRLVGSHDGFVSWICIAISGSGECYLFVGVLICGYAQGMGQLIWSCIYLYNILISRWRILLLQSYCHFFSPSSHVCFFLS